MNAPENPNDSTRPFGAERLQELGEFWPNAGAIEAFAKTFFQSICLHCPWPMN
jgi:hypothetical protein